MSTPLFRAITTGDTAAVSRLLANGEDPNECYGEDEENALLVAAVEGRVKIAELLLKAGANPNHCDLQGYTPLMGAVCAASEPLVNMLIEAGANIHARSQKSGATALHDAAAGRHASIVRILLEAGADPNSKETKDCFTPLMHAVYALAPSCVEELLQAGADPKTMSCKGDTAVTLLEYRADGLWEPTKIASVKKIRTLLEQSA